jgi:hypothetical protein
VFYELPDWQASFVTDYINNGPNVSLSVVASSLYRCVDRCHQPPAITTLACARIQTYRLRPSTASLLAPCCNALTLHPQTKSSLAASHIKALAPPPHRPSSRRWSRSSMASVCRRASPHSAFSIRRCTRWATQRTTTLTSTTSRRVSERARGREGADDHSLLRRCQQLLRW